MRNTATTKNDWQSKDWRAVFPPHPAADVFPMMPARELADLQRDIKQHGLRERVHLWRADEGTLFVLDGRNRLDALARAGMLDDLSIESPFIDIVESDDPAAYVISVNIRRRHLTKAQQAALIVRAVKATVEAAGKEGATLARSFSPHGKRGGSTNDPVLEKAVEEGKKFDISKRTVQRARADVAGRPPAKPKSPATPTRERHLASAAASSPPPPTGATMLTIAQMADTLGDTLRTFGAHGAKTVAIDRALTQASNDWRAEHLTATGTARDALIAVSPRTSEAVSQP